MKKKLKWLFLGSLMCFVIGSGFQASYGMFNNEEKIIEDIEVDNSSQLVLVDKELFLCDELLLYIMTFLISPDIVKLGETCKKINLISNKEYVWKQKIVRFNLRLSQNELEKVNKQFFTYKQLFKGQYLWNKLIHLRSITNYSNDKKLEFLNLAAENGSESAISHLLIAYRDGEYGLKPNKPEAIKLAKEYAEKGSENAGYLINSKEPFFSYTFLDRYPCSTGSIQILD